MELYKKKEECCGCSACRDVCPTGAIQMVQDREGFFYPEIKEELCTKCEKCIQVCPLKNLSESGQEHLYFGVQAKDGGIRDKSSSGGFFSVLAGYVLQNGGVVYGAAYNGEMEVVHKEVDHLNYLEEIKRTKYVQSNLEAIYIKIKERLEEGRWVSFCGTPCQVQALKLFLNQSYEKLILIDLICYGVPSPGIWHSYVKYLEYKYKGKMTYFSFRDKRNKDNGHTCSYIINGEEYVTPLYGERYCMMYFADYMLRPSCHRCKFCRPERESDFTIGDFWGIGSVRPDMDDGMGTSAVILHTQKAREIWKSIRENFNWFRCNKEEFLQPRLTGPTQVAPGRKVFMRLYQSMPFALFLKMAGGMVRVRGILK